ncbi:MAG: FtsX-like permease family protein [Nocardioidaceae bacterium]
MSLLLRLVAGRGRAALARQALVVLGTAVASVLLLVATGIAGVAAGALGGVCAGEVLPDGAVVEGPCAHGPITSSYLVQPGLRHGVVLGFVLCVVPLLVFVGTASRVAARRRDERLAGLRLAGATQAQVRGLAVLDTLLGGSVGVVLGSLAYLGVRGLVLSTAHGQLLAVSRETAPPLPSAAVVLLLLLLGLAIGAALALRSVLITPLGVARRAPRERPRPWGLALLAVSLTGVALLVASGRTRGLGTALAALLLAGTMLGLVASGTWVTARVGRAAAGRARGPVLLLAGRRLADDPRAQARAMSAVLLVVMSATVGLVVLQDFVDHADRRDYVGGFALAGAGMVFSLLVGAAGLLLTTAEGMLERRRTLAALHAGGVPLATLRRAVLAQVALPVLPASALAVAVGVIFSEALFGGQLDLTGTALLSLLLPPVAVLASTAAAAVTLPLLRRGASVEQLRAT